MVKLKYCPLCGGEAEFEWWLGRKGFEASVSCECGALVTATFITIAKQKQKKELLKCGTHATNRQHLEVFSTLWKCEV